jgi:exopolysaccharide biosynthesis WecB/TagA/CpsF family protein
LNGSDFNIRLLELAAGVGWPVFLAGAKPGVAERAAKNLRVSIPGLNIVGSADGYRSRDASLAKEIKRSGAVVVLVALGNPLQELWLDRWLPESGAMLGVGVGAFFDFQAGEVRRAAPVLNRFGIEWIYRLAQEPRRLWRRYVLGNPVFVLRVLKERYRPGRSSRPGE